MAKLKLKKVYDVTLTLKTGHAVTIKQLIPYLKDAIEAYNGCYSPDDPLFANIDKVIVRYIVRVK